MQFDSQNNFIIIIYCPNSVSSSPAIFVAQTLESDLSQCEVAGRRQPHLWTQFDSQNNFVKIIYCPNSCALFTHNHSVLRQFWSQLCPTVIGGVAKRRRQCLWTNLTLKIGQTIAACDVITISLKGFRKITFWFIKSNNLTFIAGYPCSCFLFITLSVSCWCLCHNYCIHYCIHVGGSPSIFGKIDQLTKMKQKVSKFWIKQNTVMEKGLSVEIWKEESSVSLVWSNNLSCGQIFTL